MVNLLPQKQLRKLKRTYYVRLGTVLIFLISSALIIGGVLLIPSYVVSERAADSAERYLLAVEEIIGMRERAGVTETVRVLTEQLRILDTLAVAPSSTALFEALLTRETSGIRITGIGFTKDSGVATVSIAGVATNRNTLLAFIDTLRNSEEFGGVEVPVSQLAQEADIPFSIAATYRSTP